jgi:pyruvate formate lyase activating enzyme
MTLHTDNNSQSLIFDIQRFAIHDGPGIRTVVFFKGCPLQCLWCQNPEGINLEAEILLDPDKCCKCAKCAAVCPVNKIGVSEAIDVKPIPCIPECALCSEVCPNRAIEKIGTNYNPNELKALLLKDKPFYDVSGGGVTLSGGEPLLQINYIVKLLKLLKLSNINTLIETAGYVPWENIQSVLCLIDAIYFDLKLFDEDAHLNYTNRNNNLILDNLRLLHSKKIKNVKIRIPLIPGVTDTAENLSALANFLYSEFKNYFEVCLLPYNWLTQTKYKYVYMRDAQIKKYQLQDLKTQPKDSLLKIKNIFTDIGIPTEVISFESN